jgi:hypothetical protein
MPIMRSMFSVMPAAKGSRFATGTPLASRSSAKASICSSRGHPRLSDIATEYRELGEHRHRNDVPSLHGSEIHAAQALGRIVDLKITLSHRRALVFELSPSGSERRRSASRETRREIASFHSQHFAVARFFLSRVAQTREPHASANLPSGSLSEIGTRARFLLYRVSDRFRLGYVRPARARAVGTSCQGSCSPERHRPT